MSAIRAAFADAPYPGCAHLYSVEGTPEFHPDAMRWNEPQAHIDLMHEMERTYDVWAMSTNVESLRVLLAGAPARALPAAWCRGAARLRREVSVLRGWEPVIYSVPVNPRPGIYRAWGAGMDWCLAVPNQHTTDGPRFRGQKPPAFARWLFRLLGVGGHPQDEFHDLFPGSGAVTRAWDDYRAARVERAGVEQLALFEGRP